MPTIELADGSGLKAIITPQWGGKVYALRQGARDLIMMTDPHQPIASSVRNGQVDGGKPVVSLESYLVDAMPKFWQPLP